MCAVANAMTSKCRLERFDTMMCGAEDIVISKHSTKTSKICTPHKNIFVKGNPMSVANYSCQRIDDAQCWAEGECAI